MDLRWVALEIENTRCVELPGDWKVVFLSQQEAESCLAVAGCPDFDHACFLQPFLISGIIPVPVQMVAK